MSLLFVADPLEAFKTYKDTTFAMMREAARRGHDLFACTPADLVWKQRRPRHRRRRRADSRSPDATTRGSRCANSATSSSRPPAPC